eukprot:SAG31_NODE_49394_length_142_cov_26.041494_1_plen_46_part_11
MQQSYLRRAGLPKFSHASCNLSFYKNNPDLSAADRIQPGLRIRFLH